MNNNEYDVLFIDFGMKRTVKGNDLYCIDKLSVALSRFPPQVLQVKLYDIKQITPNVIARLRGLLKPDTPAIVKVMELGVISNVNIFIRLEQNNILLPVNHTINHEMEMEK